MPIYEYRCKKGHTFEVTQSMSDDPVTACTKCRAPVERVFHPVAVHFKGSGFYTTDYGRGRASGGGDSASSDSAKQDSNETAPSKSDSAAKSDGGSKAESSGKSNSTSKSDSSSD